MIMDIHKIGFTTLTGWENYISADNLIEWLNNNASFVNHSASGQDDNETWIFLAGDFSVTYFDDDAEDMKWLHKKTSSIQIEAKDCDFIGITL